MKFLKNTLMTIMALMVLLITVNAASALPITLDKVEIDDFQLDANSVNRLDLERGQTYDVEVVFTPTQNLDDVEVQVFVSGFEFNDVEPAHDITPTFDADLNVTYRKKLSIRFSDEFEEDDYKLRVIITDRNGQEFIQSYNLKVDVPRNALKIEDVVLSPESKVTAGSALLASVRVENKGEKQQDDVRVTVGIPALGLSATEYIDEIENNDDEEETEEIYLRVPKCSQPGIYDVTVDVSYREGHTVVHATKKIEVLADPTCKPAGEEEAPKTTITLGSQLESAQQGGQAIFPITITNTGKSSKTYTVSIANVPWGEVKITPTSTTVVEAGKSQSFFVAVTANKDATVGAQVVSATVSAGNEVLQQIPLTLNVTKMPSSTMRRVLEVGLIVLVVLLVVLALIVGLSKLSQEDDDGDKGQPQAYY